MDEPCLGDTYLHAAAKYRMYNDTVQYVQDSMQISGLLQGTSCLRHSSRRKNEFQTIIAINVAFPASGEPCTLHRGPGTAHLEIVGSSYGSVTAPRTVLDWTVRSSFPPQGADP